MEKYSNQTIDKNIIEFFTCVICENILDTPMECKYCETFFCSNCVDYCPFCENKLRSNNQSKLTSIIDKIFKDKKLIKQNINYEILISNDIKDLYFKNKIDLIVKKDEIKLNPKNTMELINELLDKISNKESNLNENNFSNNNYLNLSSEISILTEDYIKEKTLKNPNDFIDIKEVLNYPIHSPFYLTGILCQYLKDIGIKVYIEKKSSNENLLLTTLNWISTGIINYKTLNLHLDYGERVNNQILNNEIIKKDFILQIKKKILKEIPINENELNFLSLKEGSIKISFSSNSNIPNVENIKNKNMEIINSTTEMLIKACLLSPEIFEPKYNITDINWVRKGGLRGGQKYIPPIGFLGYSLNILNKYDNGDNSWIGMTNSNNEWWVAYHGAGRGQNDNQVKNVIKSIINKGFKSGIGQAYQHDNNINYLSNKEYPKVGIGVYFSNEISVAESYAGIVNDLNGKQYKIAFMCRVNPIKTRVAQGMSNYFILDPNVNCVRIYRILLKPLNFNIESLNGNNFNNYKKYGINNINLIGKNSIMSVFNVDRNDRKKKLQILNYCDENKNELENNCELYINGNNVEFTFNNKFNFEGEYEIFIINKNPLSNMNSLFKNCYLTIIDLSNCDTQNVTNMKEMFYGCSNLISINIPNFNTNKVTNMNGMFSNCSSLKYLDLSNFNTSNVIDFGSMFLFCNSLNSINLLNFDISNAENLNWMFSSCSSLNIIDLHSFKNNKVKNMNGMFSYCTSLQSINLLNFIFNNEINTNKMFFNINKNCHLNTLDKNLDDIFLKQINN